MKTAIIGAGMAGLACAEQLVAQGHQVTLHDKGRGPGGRMSTRRISTDLGEVSFDHGAQYFTARDPAFVAQLGRWLETGAAAPWPAAGNDAYVGLPGMNAPVRHMAQALDVHWSSRIDAIERTEAGWRLTAEGLEAETVEAVIVATPAEQAAPLLAEPLPDISRLAADTRSDPCWTLMLAFDRPCGFAHDAWRGDGAISWIARNSAKPGRDHKLETFVVQASPDWSRAHLEQSPDEVAALLLAQFTRLAPTGLPLPVVLTAHRWRYAKTSGARHGPVWDDATKIGVCGDWLEGPRVENAWLCGHNLARRIG
jgi:predicted NAD/FAD-dependent oxidoreductase